MKVSYKFYTKKGMEISFVKEHKGELSFDEIYEGVKAQLAKGMFTIYLDDSREYITVWEEDLSWYKVMWVSELTIPSSK